MLHVGQERPQALQHSIRRPTVLALTGHPVKQERGEVTPRNMHPLEAVPEMLPVHAWRRLHRQQAVSDFGDGIHPPKPVRLHRVHDLWSP